MAQQGRMTILEFQQRFTTDEACRDHLFKIRWHNGPSCPRCTGKHFYKITTRNIKEENEVEEPKKVWFRLPCRLILKDDQGLSRCASWMTLRRKPSPNLLSGTFHLSRFHQIIGNLKALILGTYHGLGTKHLPAYLGGYCFRTNRRHFSGQVFNRLLNACMLSSPVTYRMIVDPVPSG